MIEPRQRPMYLFLAVMTAASMVGLQGYAILFNNFAVEQVGLEGNHIGVIQSVREIPGLLALLAVYILMVLKEHKLSALSIVLLGIGVALTGIFPTYAGLSLTTLVMSFGFHYYETTNQSLTLQYFSTGMAPLVLGKLRSLAALSSIASAVVIWLLGSFLEYQGIYLVIGSLVVAAGVWGLCQDPTHMDIPHQHLRLVLKRRYWLYYVLTFLSGARRQIFMVFSMFLLVKIFHFSIQEMTALFIINNAINWFLNPLIGKAIIAFGERTLCTVEYLGVIAVFLTYAYTSSKGVAAGMYILDYIFFNFAVAIRTYFQKVADPRDIAPGTAVGFTINHIAAVILPALGGYFWMINYRIPFIAGAALGLVSLIFAQFIRTPKNAPGVPLPVGCAVAEAE